MFDFVLRFPLLSGGKPRGVNSSGIAAFKGDPAKSLAREWAQNAIDAFHQTFPIELDFELKEYSINDLPCFDELKKSIEASAKYWPKQKQEQRFCAQVLDKFTDRIPVLVITDRGTTGLRGGDNEQSGQWFGLVEGTETSVGDEGRGGSYGIGKNAAFAASWFQTVFFSTHSVDNEFAFKGVSVLMTHRNEDGEETQADGSIGIFCKKTGKVMAIRDPGKIPEQFKRSEPGLSTYIPGYKPAYKNPDSWQDELVMSLLSNFWPAIHFEKVTFRVQNILIDKQTLPELMVQYSEKNDGDKESFQAHHYYRVFSSANRRVFKGNLKYLEGVDLYAVKEDDVPQMPNNVAITRQNGMIIKCDGFRGLGFPFAGLLVCENPVGNEILRDMEPPQHHDLHPKQLENMDGEKVLKELHDWIRERLLEFKPKLDKEEYDLPDMARYFPMPDEEEAPLEGQGSDHHENLNRIPRNKEVPVTTIPEVVPAIHMGNDASVGGIGEGEGEEPDPIGEGDGKDTGGETETSSGQRGTMKKVSSRGRSLGDGKYKLYLRAGERFAGVVQIFASGDDAVREPLAILGARNVAGEELVVRSGKIVGVEFNAELPIVLEVVMKEKERYALDVEVYDEA